MDERQEVLVPPNGDAVFGHAAEPLEYPFVEQLVDIVPALERSRRTVALAGERGRQRLDLETVDGDNAEAFVEQVMRQRVAGRTQPDDQHVASVVRQRIRPIHVERIPARQQAVDLDAPRHLQHVGQDARFDLRDVDRLLLLVDAGLHAVVADAMAGSRAHRIVDGDDGQRADGITGLPHHVHLGDLLVQRAAGQRNAERVRQTILPSLSRSPFEHESLSRSWQRTQ